jgi:hypothetical protein
MDAPSAIVAAKQNIMAAAIPRYPSLLGDAIYALVPDIYQRDIRLVWQIINPWPQ